MKTTLLLTLVVGALHSMGCAYVPSVVPVRYPVMVSTGNAYDLEVEVWDRAINGPLPGVLVSIHGSMAPRSRTNVRGLVKLPTPYGARDVHLAVTYIAHNGLEYTEERWIHLEHSFTRCRVEIETRRYM